MTVTSIADSRRRVTICVDDRLSVMADSAIRALANLDVYQRSGQLVDVVRDAKTSDGIARPEGTPRIRPIPFARLREILENAIDCSKKAEGGAKRVRPPKELVETVLARGQWCCIRSLVGVTNWPVLRPDGTILAKRGYDKSTGMLCESDVTIELPDQPTRTDAAGALAVLNDLLQDFPFISDADRSSWLATLLSVLARPAIDGPVPLTLIGASQRGSGKTLLADMIGAIASGRALPRRSAPADKQEWDKAMLGIALSGDPILLLDNVTGTLKSDALDAVLTGTEYRGRVLGRNEELTLPVRTVFIVTANNATLSHDLVRRSLEIRLEPTQERPEARSEFRYPDLLSHCRRYRTRLLSAAFTILRAHVVAGRPAVSLRPMGSYEAWSRVVRGPLVWLGQADPATTQDALRETADTEHEAVNEALAAMHACLGDRPFTARQLRERICRDGQNAVEARLRDALSVLCDTDRQAPSTQRLGVALRSIRGQVCGSLRLKRPTEHGREGAVWQVQSIHSTPSSRDDGEGREDDSIREELGS